MFDECQKCAYNNSYRQNSNGNNNRQNNDQRINSINKDSKQPFNEDQEIEKVNLHSKNSVYTLQLESDVTNLQKFPLPLDTGAEVLLIRFDILNKNLLEELDTPIILVFSCIQHTEIECHSIGTVHVPLKYDGHIYTFKFHVFDNPHVNLLLHGILGLNVIRASHAAIEIAKQQITFTTLNYYAIIPKTHNCSQHQADSICQCFI